jgi:predicted DNA-binding transcriptional regulator YafY
MRIQKEPTMSDTLLRQWAMLRFIPRLPRKVDTAKLQYELAKAGHDINLRTIQRDLNKLSEVLPLVADNAKPQGWSWAADAKVIDLPALDPQAALTFKLVESHMQQLLPASTLNYLQPWFHAANGVLDQHGNGLAHWPDKVRVLPRGLPQKAPDTAPEIAEAIYQAVLLERQLQITYPGKTEQTEARSHTVHPLALVVRDRVVYLICVFDGYADPRQLAMHRILLAEMLNETVQRPEGFSIDAYIAQGEFGVVLNPQPIVLEAEFFRYVAIHLLESPIADDQVIEDVDEDNVLLRATVPDTLELRLWLRSFGDEIAVIGPNYLREEFREMAVNLKDYYTA